MFDQFTDRARKICALARHEAERLNHDYIGTEHLLLGLIVEGSGVAANVLENLDVNIERAREEVKDLVKPAPEPLLTGAFPFTPRGKKVLEFAIDEARLLGHKYVGSEHLLLGVLRETKGLGAQVLINMGLNLDDVRCEVMEFLGIKDNPEEIHSTSKNHFFEMKYKELSDKFDLHQAMKDLDQLDRQILYRRYNAGASVEEIARELNLSVPAVESRIAESKERLIKALFGGS